MKTTPTPDNSIERDRSLSSSSLQSTNSLAGLMDGLDDCESEGVWLMTVGRTWWYLSSFIILRSRPSQNTGDGQGSFRPCDALHVLYLAISQGWLYRSELNYFLSFSSSSPTPFCDRQIVKSQLWGRFQIIYISILYLYLFTHIYM